MKSESIEKLDTQNSKTLEKQDTASRQKSKSIKKWNKKKTETKETSNIERHISKKVQFLLKLI